MDNTLRKALWEILRPLIQLVTNLLNPEIGEEWTREFKHFLRKEPCWVGVVETVKSVLDTFFSTRRGLRVSDDFRRLVLAKARPSEAVEMAHFNLLRDMTDAEIEKKLGENRIWEESALCATLKKYIRAQWNGKSGKLLNNGYANLFYTSFCVVSVGWRAGSREGYVHTWQRGGVEWGAGRRAFSPARPPTPKLGDGGQAT